MDSLSLYTSICQNNCYDNDITKLENVDRIVECIFYEIMAPPYNIGNSLFIQKTVELINILNKPGFKTAQISPVDAYVVINSLFEYIENNNSKAKMNRDNLAYAEHLFRRRIFREELTEKMNKVIYWLKKIQGVIEDMRESYSKKAAKENADVSEANGKKAAKENADVPEANVKKAAKENAAASESNSKKAAKENADAPESRSNQESKENTDMSEMQSESGIDESKKITAEDKTMDTECQNTDACDERAKLRIENNRQNVKQWHEEKSVINDKLLEIQPIASKLLKKMMSFSDEITESYVIQFAKMQIELFNLIADNYDYHKKALENSDSSDYRNAVSNYAEFLDMIVDNLSAFGIEEIVSSNGTGFDGSIHEVVGSGNFSPRFSKVKESIRTGFRYNDIIIQKEKITLEGENA